MSDFKRAEAAMRALTGTMNDTARKSMREANEEAKDWQSVCPRCMAKLYGTLKSIREHDCDGGKVQ